MMIIKDLLIQFVASFFGTIAFALIFGVPKKYALTCGIVGASGWLLFTGLKYTGLTVTEATFFATVLAALLSRFAAVFMQCPATVFITAALLPMVPGAGIYWTTYYLVMGDTTLAGSSGFAALKSVIAIVMGFIVVFELPSKIFNLPKRKK